MQLDPGDVRRLGECFLHGISVPVGRHGSDIAARPFPDERSTGLDRAARIDYRGQIFVFNDNSFGRILRLLARLGNDRHDRLAGVEHLAFGERRARRRRHRRAVGALEERRKRDVLDAVGAQIGHRPRGDYTRHFQVN